ncbi:MAG: hypothetical protein SF182_01730 [Deltaproteobacteria bacterium]|nr:hypothetical protein [Deltaproteobacteria bacterium]
MANQGNKKIADGMRVVCSLPNASHCINGLAFAAVLLDPKKGPIHISERLDVATAERFCGIEGYELWTGSEDAHARTIEDALDAVRRAPSTPGAPSGSAVEADLRRQVTELQNSNMAMAKDLSAANRRVRELETANTALTEELDRLKATGARAAA